MLLNQSFSTRGARQASRHWALLGAGNSTKFVAKTSVRRNTVRAVLFLWLFALATGWANACLLQTRGTHLHIAPHGDAAANAGVTVSAGHVGAVAADDGDFDSSSQKRPCQKFCDDGSQSLAKFSAGIDLTNPGMAAITVLAWRTTDPSAPSSRHVRGLQPPIAAPPIRQRFSRLTL